MDNTIYDWKNIGVNEITNFYLYGQKDTPKNLVDEKLIRQKIVQNAKGESVFEDGTALPSIKIDAVSFMDKKTGAGRFANAAHSDMVSRFFLEANPEFAPTGVRKTFTQKEMINIVGNTQYIRLQQYNYSDATDDYAQRSYIYNTSDFGISDKAVFVIEAKIKGADGKYTGGEKHIKNMSIIPSSDNFDFESSNPIAKLGNALIEPKIDPSGIGRKVNIIFENKENIPTKDYVLSDFWKDIKRNNDTFSPTLLATRLSSEIDGVVKNLWDSGVTKFLTEHNRPIIYGTDGADNFDVADIFRDSRLPTLKPYAKNGVVIIAGGGDDVLKNIPKDSIIHGGAGADTYEASLKSSFAVADPSPEDKISLSRIADDGTKYNYIVGGTTKDIGLGPLKMLSKSASYTDDEKLSLEQFKKDSVLLGISPVTAILYPKGDTAVLLPWFKSGDMGITIDEPIKLNDNSDITHGLAVNNKIGGKTLR